MDTVIVIVLALILYESWSIHKRLIDLKEAAEECSSTLHRIREALTSED